jgi:hypothetical protein
VHTSFLLYCHFVLARQFNQLHSENIVKLLLRRLKDLFEFSASIVPKDFLANLSTPDGFALILARKC